MKQELIIRDESLRAQACRALAQLDLAKPWRITIQPYRKNRTTDQNNLLWAMYTEIANHTGHTPDEIHEWCKAGFLVPRYMTIKGTKIGYRTTTKLTTAEMSEYMERIRAWAHTDLGVTLSAWGQAA